MSVKTPTDKAENCWEYVDCPKKVRDACVVFSSKNGKECWFSFDLSEGCPALKEKGGCFFCLWFKKKNPGIIQ